VVWFWWFIAGEAILPPVQEIAQYPEQSFLERESTVFCGEPFLVLSVDQCEFVVEQFHQIIRGDRHFVSHGRASI
jgi:hypothetical protein